MSSVHAERKKREFFVPFIWSEGNFFNMCFISMYIVSNTPSVHTFTYRKTLLHTLCCLVLKLLKAFSVSLIKALIQTMKKKEEHVSFVAYQISNFTNF